MLISLCLTHRTLTNSLGKVEIGFPVFYSWASPKGTFFNIGV